PPFCLLVFELCWPDGIWDLMRSTSSGLIGGLLFASSSIHRTVRFHAVAASSVARSARSAWHVESTYASVVCGPRSNGRQRGSPSFALYAPLIPFHGPSSASPIS